MDRENDQPDRPLITVQLLKHDVVAAVQVCEGEAEDLGGAIKAVETWILEDKCEGDQVVMTLPRGWRFSEGQLRYSSDWL